jgi:hypothetical protein
MKVAIHQPNYLPWCGYFAKLKACEIFIFLDDAQMSKSSYVQRTKMRSPVGDQWLTLPARIHNTPRIADVSFADSRWPRKHVATIGQVYRKAPFFDEVMRVIEPAYASPGINLSTFNRRLIESVGRYLGIERQVCLISELNVASTGDQRLVELTRKVRGTHYISGAAGIELEVRMYSPRVYEAAGFPFLPGLSILDALFVLGSSANRLLVYDEPRGSALVAR